MLSISQEKNTHQRPHQTPQNEGGGKSAIQKLHETAVPATPSSRNGPDILSLLESRSFMRLTPMTSVSTVSTPAASDDIWDPPETPCGRSRRATTNRLLTPITPPTPAGYRVKLESTPPPKLSFDIRASPIIKQQLLEKSGSSSEGDVFEPKKLFRRLTDELEAISRKNAAAARLDYSIYPSFDFTVDTNSAGSSRTPSKASKFSSATPAVQPTLDEANNSVNAKQPQKALFSQSKLPKLLEHTLPLDMQARLAEKPELCVASLVTNPSKRCGYKQKAKRPLGEILRGLEKLARCKDEEDYCGVLDLIKELVHASMCGTHQNVALKQLRVLFKDVTKMEEVDRPIIATYSVATIPQTSPQPKPEVANRYTPVQLSSSSHFILYQPTETQNLSISLALRQKASSPLGPKKDHAEGFVYIFWDKQHFGMVKIGYTNNLSRRLREWDNSCKHKHLYHPNDGIQVNMEHVYRVEQLVHTELKEFRRRRPCDGCGRMHKEWFEVEEAHAAKVVRKWREWILQEPYVEDAGSKQWVIKPDMLDTLELVCEPVPRDVSAQRRPRRSGAGVRRSSQKNQRARKAV